MSVRGDWTIPRAGVDPRGIFYGNPLFFKQLNDDEAKFVLAHEVMHLLMLHFGRQGSRKHKRWNRSTDRVLNHSIRSIGLTPPDGALFPLAKEHEEYTAEEAYEVEPEQTGDETPYDFHSVPSPGAGCGAMTRGGDGDGDDDKEGDLPGEGQTPSGGVPTMVEAARIWRNAAAQAQAQARATGAGSNTGDLLARILDVPPSRVKWSALLNGMCHRALAQHGRDDVSFTRRNRRSFDSDFILPGGVTYCAQVAAVVDTSGSISDESLAQAISEVESISAATNVAIYLVTHDADVQWQGWVHPGTRRGIVANAFTGRGGTVFAPAYAAVEEASKRFDGLVHLTDGEPWDPWPERPRNVKKLIVALLGCKSQHSIPEEATVVEAEI